MRLQVAEAVAPLGRMAQDAPPGSVAVVRALQLGDLLCAVPAFRALRAALPESRITLIGLPWARTLLDRFPHYLDGLIEFPGFPGIPEREYEQQRAMSFLSQVHERPFDLAIQMHGNGSVMNEFTQLLGATSAAGFAPGPDEPRPGPSFLPYPNDTHEVQRHLRLVEFLGAEPQGTDLEFPLLEEDEQELRSLGATYGLRPRDYVVLHPGARSEYRRWDVGRFAAVADALARRGECVILTGGADEAPLAAAVAESMSRPALNLAGRTSLGGLAALLSGARLLIANDTGVSHLAAALQTPSVIIFTGSDPARWAPLDRERHRSLGRGRPDGRTQRVSRRIRMQSYPQSEAGSDVTPAMVLDAAEDLLGA